MTGRDARMFLAGVLTMMFLIFMVHLIGEVIW